MSRKFNQTDTLDGLVQEYEREIGKEYGFISGNTTRLKAFTSATRSAWDRYLHLALKSSGTHQFDDSNHEDYPFIEADLVANQRDITYTTDDNSTFILDIFKVMLKNSDGVYFELQPIDQQYRGQGMSIWDGQSATGTPTQYDKTANGIIFDVLPNYNWRQATEGERGVKMFVNREASYFTYTDTTKLPGCPGIHHDYFFLRPALEYAGRNNLANYDDLRDRVKEFEGDERNGVVGMIENYFSRRSKDERYIMSMKKINYI